MGYEGKFKEYKNVSQYEPKETVKEVSTYPIKALPDRGLTKETCETFGVRVAVNAEDGKTIEAVYFPYYDQKGKLTGYKKRNMTMDKAEKGHFTVVGTVGVTSKLFGQHVAEAQNRAKRDLHYQEGEYDVMSTYQACVEDVAGGKYDGMAPFVVGLNCGTANAVEATLHNMDFIGKFNNIIFGFDNDFATAQERVKKIKRGKECRDDVAGCLIGEGLGLFVIDYPEAYKDPSDMLQDKKSSELAKLMSFGKRAYSAEKISRAADISFEEFLAPKPEGVYVDAFPKLMEKIHGFRTGELIIFTSPSGVGKSTVTSIFASKFIEDGDKTGMIYLEEQNKETLQRVVANHLGVNYNKFKTNPLGCGKTIEQIKEAYDYIVEQDKLIMLDHFGSLPIGELMSKIKTMHFVEGCKYIILDHLSVVISGTALVDERKELDMVLTELAAFCAANDVCIIAVSHINRTADYKAPKTKDGEAEKPYWVKINKEMLRGSSGLEQLSWCVLGLEPEIMPDRSRGRVRLTVMKNRTWGYLGVCDIFTVDDDTWEVLLSEEEDEGY